MSQPAPFLDFSRFRALFRRGRLHIGEYRRGPFVADPSWHTTCVPRPHSEVNGLEHDAVRIRFLERRGIVSVMEFDVPRGWTELNKLRSALLTLRLQVISSDSQYFGGRLVHWLRAVELDGAPIRDYRQPAVLASLNELLAAKPPLSRRPTRLRRAS